EDELVPETAQHPPSALEVDANLSRAVVSAHVHRVDGVLVDDPVGVETMARLELLDRLLQTRVVDRGLGWGARLARNRETRTDRWDSRIGRSGLDRLAGRHRGPPALRRNLAELRERADEAAVDEVVRFR